MTIKNDISILKKLFYISILAGSFLTVGCNKTGNGNNPVGTPSGLPVGGTNLWAGAAGLGMASPQVLMQGLQGAYTSSYTGTQSAQIAVDVVGDMSRMNPWDPNPSADYVGPVALSGTLRVLTQDYSLCNIYPGDYQIRTLQPGTMQAKIMSSMTLQAVGQNGYQLMLQTSQAMVWSSNGRIFMTANISYANGQPCQSVIFN